MSRPTSQVNWQSCLLDDLPQHSIFCEQSYNLTCPLFYSGFFSSQEEVLLAWRWLVWWLSAHDTMMDKIPQQPERQFQERIQMKIRNPNINDSVFYPEPHDPNHLFIKSLMLIGGGDVRLFSAHSCLHVI